MIAATFEEPIMGLKDILTSWWQPQKPPILFSAQFNKFMGLLQRYNRVLEVMGDMGDKLGGEYVFDTQYMIATCEELGDLMVKLITDLSVLSGRKHMDLFMTFESIRYAVQEELAGRPSFGQINLTLTMDSLGQETVDAVGSKLNTLGLIRNVLGHHVPDGFVVTTKAFFDFLEHIGLRDRSRKALEALDREDEAGFEALCADVRQAILGGELPRSLASSIKAQAEVMAIQQACTQGHEPLYYAVRSSAWGEDGEISFAGQYHSVLGVSRQNLLEAYKQVVASAYSEDAWRYRLLHGYKEEELAMAVGVQCTIDAKTSGALQTYALDGDDALIVTCAPGLGVPVMGGSLQVDAAVVDRKPPYRLRSLRAEEKKRFLRLSPGGGTEWQTVAKGDRDKPCITQEQLTLLVRAGLDIEGFLKRPVEVEWCFDQRGELFILQARPLRIDTHAQSVPTPSDQGKQIALARQGMVVQQGVAMGKVVVVRDDEDLGAFPYGAILVAPFPSPRYARIITRVKGIITDIGSPAGHMATIAREHRVPTIVNTGNATTTLKSGREITLDASHNTLYEGIIPALRRFELTEQCVFEDTYEYRLLRRLLLRITPLNMVDPNSPDFRPDHCKTYHDIARYIHETAVEELIRLSETRGHHPGRARRLGAEIPLGLMIIDVAEGLRPAIAKGEEVKLEDIFSRPLHGLLEGLIHSGMWSNKPVPVDLGSFMSSFTRTFASSMASPKQIGRNLAVVSREYANIHLRLGYHFNIIDAYLDESANDNYITFRFMGGVTGLERRSRRSRFVAEILEHFDFSVNIRGDLVVGSIKHIPLRIGLEKMHILGGLVGYTRQLDVLLSDDADLKHHVGTFLERISAVMEA